MTPNEIAGVSEIAEMLGIAKRTAAKYVDLPGFPEPFDYLSTGRVWRRTDVEAWARTSLPLRRGRPRKTDP